MDFESFKTLMAGLGGLATTVFGGGYIWKWLRDRNKDRTSLDLQREANRAKMNSDQFGADIKSGSRAEKALLAQIDDLKDHIKKLEERMDKLETENREAVSKVANLEAEVKLKDEQISSLNQRLNTACKLLTDKGVSSDIIELLRGLK